MAAARLGLSRGQRIRRRVEFVRIQTGGLRVTTRHFLFLLAAASGPAALPRLGVVASRKIGGAVQRNRAKRLVRETFRTSPTLFPSGADVVVIIRSGAPALCLAAVEAELDAVRSLLRRRAAEAIARRVAAPPQPPEVAPRRASDASEASDASDASDASEASDALDASDGNRL